MSHSASPSSLSLYELNTRIADCIRESFDTPIWITAETIDVRTASNGHCYCELIEKGKKSGTIIARCKATIWAQRWWLLRESFEQQTGQIFQSGLKVMVLAQVQMHETYGLSLNILDIDPTYTLGDMAQRRQAIIQQLTDEGLADMNKGLPLPTLPQRIAIISTNNAAGYGDFVHQLQHNEWGVVFYHHLFPATMQGEQTKSTIIAALDKIYRYQELFDLVVIIRGGGATTDLNSFDSYELAVNIANFPLPIITGIGHERDYTIADMVAHTSHKTPTAVAAWLIETLGNSYRQLQEWREQVLHYVSLRVHEEQQKLFKQTTLLHRSNLKITEQINRLQLLQERIRWYVTKRIEQEHRQLHLTGQNIQMVQPDNLLQRGFSITRVNGKAVRDINDCPPGTRIETQVANGRIVSTTTDS